MNEFYLDYAAYLQRFFPGMKVQKISVNTGAGCPNRDGTIGTGGCIYCNNESFTPSYCFDHTGIREQIIAGKRFFAKKYPNMQYLAYFQSFTNTYNKNVASLREQFVEALEVEGILGLIIGTRPDCIGAETVKMLAELNKKQPVFVELGVESMHDDTLRIINRGHDSSTTCDAIERLASAGLHTGVHLIAGLPEEDDDRVLESIDKICELPVESIKLHHLQVLKGTSLEKMLKEGRIAVNAYTPESFLDLCVRIVKRVPRNICIERFLASAPPEMVISPKWGMKNYEFVNLLHKRLAES